MAVMRDRVWLDSSIEEDQDWRGDLAWFHTAFRGLICVALGLHAVMTPNTMHDMCAALQCGSFGLRLACLALLERRSAARAGARLWLFSWMCMLRIAEWMNHQVKDPRDLMQQNIDSRQLNGFIWLILGAAVAMQPVSTGERLAMICSFAALTIAGTVRCLQLAPPFDYQLLRDVASFSVVPLVMGYCGTHMIEEFVIRPRVANVRLETARLHGQLRELQDEIRELTATQDAARQISAAIQTNRTKELRERKKREVQLRQKANELSLQYGRDSTNQLLRALGVPEGLGRTTLRAIREERDD